MHYTILLHPKAHAFLQTCETDIAQRIRKKLVELQTHPEKGKPLRYSDFFRLRVGDYRVIYEINYKKHQVIILYIGHRKDVYDDFSRLF